MATIRPFNPCPGKSHKREKGWEMQFSYKVWVEPNRIWWSIVREKTEHKSRRVREDELGKDEGRFTNSLLRWAVSRHPVRQHPLAWDPTWHLCPRRDACCVRSFLLSANSSSNRALGNLCAGLGLWAELPSEPFPTPGFSSTPFKCTPVLCCSRLSVFIPFLLHQLLQYRESQKWHSTTVSSGPHRRTLSATTEANGKTVSPSKYWKIILCPIKVLFKIEG